MALTREELLNIQVDIDNSDPVLRRVKTEDMIKYLTDRGFSHAVTYDGGFAAYTHSDVIVHSEKKGDYSFGVHINTNEERIPIHEVNVLTFLNQMQNFYQLKDGSKPSKLEILSDLL